MVMDTLQIRMNQGLLKRVDTLVKSGVYSNRSDVIRDAVRRFVWEKEVGSITNNNKNSVDEIKEIRKKISEEPIDIDKVNDFGTL
ncbi:ribbon-helix-helix protein, CopG family [Candidatus Pacearchaeota archaeon]|nr:ribbon-helix-helix protein, CopG family [Candidatus Pacearchaeota archaeon]